MRAQRWAVAPSSVTDPVPIQEATLSSGMSSCIQSFFTGFLLAFLLCACYLFLRRICIQWNHFPVLRWSLRLFGDRLVDIELNDQIDNSALTNNTVGTQTETQLPTVEGLNCQLIRISVTEDTEYSSLSNLSNC